MSKILIDLEFTGLDNSFISDNEIIQVKMKNKNNGKEILKNFNSKTPIKAFTRLEHKVERYADSTLFSKKEFEKMLCEIGANTSDEFHGFGTSQDVLMLAKYGIDLSINDIRTYFQKVEDIDFKMATEGSGLESTYFLVTGEFPPATNHSDLSEMFLIEKLFDAMSAYSARDYMEVMPHGDCAGMLILDYVAAHRRRADGYRMNNDDALTDALDHWIWVLEDEESDEDYSFEF